MSIYECKMVYSEREPSPDVRYPNVEMVNIYWIERGGGGINIRLFIPYFNYASTIKM